MDSHHALHLPGVLPGQFLERSLICKCLLGGGGLCVVHGRLNVDSFFKLDSSLWHHVVGFGRSLLLDASHSGFQQRCLHEICALIFAIGQHSTCFLPSSTASSRVPNVFKSF